SDQDFKNYCKNYYAEHQECPEDICLLACRSGHYRDCFFECIPKECYMIDVEHCPLVYCQILKGCEKQNVCYQKIDEKQFDCGGLAYAGQDLKCCPGLVKRCGIEFFDGSCDIEGKFSSQSVPICLPCGDGVCHQFENRCNCPEDCGQFERKDIPREENKNNTGIDLN
ncbi:MAG TPA: hypothetical protein PKH98_04255, partial [Candidatus Omnitrophota bacterium]|nr:hypothetical protein [Candidatus Omnitrophota bacterium]